MISITVSVAESGDVEEEYFLHSQAHHTLLTDVRKCVMSVSVGVRTRAYVRTYTCAHENKAETNYLFFRRIVIYSGYGTSQIRSFNDKYPLPR